MRAPALLEPNSDKKGALMAIETNTLVIGWNRAVPGREHAAAELFGQVVGYYDKQQKSGKITSWEPMFLQQHGGDLNGFFVLKGTGANLDALRSDDEFIDIQMRAGLILQNFGVVPGYSGMATVQEMMTRWTKAIPR
jgi:hypothetical protein